MEPQSDKGQRWGEARASKNVPSQRGTASGRGTAPRQGLEGASNPSMAPAAGMPSFMEDVRLPPVDASLLVGIDKAIAEITTTPPANLHRTAAYSWGSRAVACFRVCSTKKDLQECLSYFYLGEHYREAALAHAAMGEQWQPLATEIEAAMAEDRASAFVAMRKFSAEPEGGKKAPERLSGQTPGRVSGKKGK